MFEREVAITGMGLITPNGKNLGENWENLKAMKTGIGHYPDDLPRPLQYKGKVSESKMPEGIPPKLAGHVRFLNRGAVLGFLSALEASGMSGINASGIAPGRRALYIASGDFTMTGYDFMHPATKDASGNKFQGIDFGKLNRSAIEKVNPFFLLESLHNNLFSFLSAYLEFMGPNTSLASLSPCGGHALELAYRAIQHDKADIAMAVAYCNWITDIPLYEIQELGILSQCRSGAHSFRPFDRHRDGFIPGEGGAAIFLEAADIAAQRNAKILGRIRGTANCAEFISGRAFSVPPEVSRRGIELALEDGGCSLNDMAFISPHGSGTQKGDRSELRSIRDIFTSKKQDAPVCGMKPYTGHLGSASDIAEIILGIKGVKEGLVPATLNFEKPDNEFSDLKISGSHQGCREKLFMSVSYGLGGQSSTSIIEAD